MAKCAKVLTTMQDLNVLDTIINSYGIKYFFVESGEYAIKSKCEEIEIEYNLVNKYWCELSWGSDGDKYDFAYNDFGETLSQAISNCLNSFEMDVKSGRKDRVNAAIDAGIYEKLIE